MVILRPTKKCNNLRKKGPNECVQSKIQGTLAELIRMIGCMQSVRHCRDRVLSSFNGQKQGSVAPGHRPAYSLASLVVRRRYISTQCARARLCNLFFSFLSFLWWSKNFSVAPAYLNTDELISLFLFGGWI